MAAREHVEDQGPEGGTGHEGANGSTTESRLKKQEASFMGISENISYGEKTAQSIIMQWIIDDDVKNRGHRTNLFNSEYRWVGVGCGTHKNYGFMCVADFGGQLNIAKK